MHGKFALLGANLANRVSAEPHQQQIRDRIANWCAENRRALAACGMSWLVHLCLFLALAAVLLHTDIYRAGSASINSRFAEAPDPNDELTFVATPFEDPSEADAAAEAFQSSATTPVVTETRTVADSRVPAPQVKVLRSLSTGERSVDDHPQTGLGDVSVQLRLQDQFAGRTAEQRRQLVQTYGGTPESEAAVWAGLGWLAAHQLGDGSWNFDHTIYACGSSCTKPGTLHDCEIGATAMALLCFLGAGQTHQTGEFQEVVDAGLNFMLEELKWIPDQNRVDLRGGSNMYVHGMASTVLSEAYAMTGDTSLQEPAQGAVNFIVWAQDDYGGGWRYKPNTPGDTSVVGWQVMALMSAHVAELNVPEETVERALRFLRTVQARRGAGFGYTSNRARPSTTAIGLLSKMYLQSRATRKSFAQGARFVGRTGPSRDDMYYNYYATQFMHHYGGYPWETWNEKMRDWLVTTQEQHGHAAGSWMPGTRWSSHGGRLYMTTMAIMTLEVYYRHLPLYQRGAQLTKK